jgi:hypothetical protein
MPNRNIKLGNLLSCCFELISNFEKENQNNNIENNYILNCKSCNRKIILNNNIWEFKPNI